MSHPAARSPRILAVAVLGVALVLAAAAPAPASACPGDCDGDGVVTVDEILTGVSIALGNRSLGECPAFDGNGDLVVTVDEVILALNHALGGCPAEEPTATPTPVEPTSTATPVGPPSPTPTATASPTVTPVPARGPRITYFGLAAADGTQVQPVGTDSSGVPIFARVAGAGFLIVVEGRTGLSGSPVGQCNTSYDPFSAELRPHIQILTSRPLGAGNPAVCDGPVGPESGFGCGGRPEFIQPFGGIPAIDPPDFDAPTRAVADALNDFGCRMTYLSAAEPCTKSAFGNPRFFGNDSTDQFCSAGVVSPEMLFPSGDTRLTARLRDFAGNHGEPRQIIVRVP